MSSPPCFYGCKLDPKTLIWKCKLFEDMKDADAFALSNQNQSISTRLIPTHCASAKHFAKNPHFLKQILLQSDLAFAVKIE